MKANEAMKELQNINYSISQIMKKVGYVDSNDYNNIDFDMTNAGEIFKRKEIGKVFYMLECAKKLMDYTDLPIKYESKLLLNEISRYETDQGDYFTCGSIIEYLSNDTSYYEYPFWRKSTVESKGNKYYIVDEPKVSMNGLIVRVRG